MAERRRKTENRRQGRAQTRTPETAYEAYPGYEDMIAREVAEQAQYVEPRRRMTAKERRAKHKELKRREAEIKKEAKALRKKKKQAELEARATAAQEVQGDDAGLARDAAAAASRRTRDAQAQDEQARRGRKRRRQAREIKPFRFRDVKHKPVLYRPNDAKRADRLYKIMMTAAVAAIAIFVCCVFFEVRTVRASGSERYLGEEIVHYSGIENGEKMLFLNTRKAASNILSSLPYIKSVSIRRRFPSTVCIEVEERTPTAKIVNGNFAYIIDDEGYLLEYTAASSRFDLPVIICAAPTRLEEGKQLVFSDPLMLETLQNVLSQIVKSEWIKSIDSINIERIYSISFLYQGRFDVKLGDTGDLDMKLRLLREVIARNSEDAYGTIDVSSTERVSFQPSR